ncbi:MAG: DUF1178 family protein [Hyphomicrobiaceae bacterium]|jgi:hypothetical protein|nr:DUF1178 family protein [Hyphomicrobiaceae bacterium]
MIKYRLICNESHEFEGWFRGSDEYDAQASNGHLSCPVCASTAVSKAVMAPNVATSRGVAPMPRQAPGPDRQREIFAALRKLRSEVEARSTYVGERFAEEARKIHFGEAEERVVHGEATMDEVHALSEDGVPVMPLPRLPKDLN